MMSNSTPEIDDQALAKLRRHYERLGDEELVAIASFKANDLTNEARFALKQELLARNMGESGVCVESIEKAESASTIALPLEQDAPAQLWHERAQTTADYGKVVRFARWLAFIPATWQASYVHGWILKLFGVNQVSELAADSNNLLAFGVAGFLTPLCAISLGLWVCPAKAKTKPAIVLAVLYAIGTACSLYMFSRPGVSLALRHLFGVDAFVTIAVSVMIVGVCLLAPWRNAPLTRGADEAKA